MPSLPEVLQRSLDLFKSGKYSNIHQVVMDAQRSMGIDTIKNPMVGEDDPIIIIRRAMNIEPSSLMLWCECHSREDMIEALEKGLKYAITS